MLVWRGKIPLIINPSFWILACLIGWFSSYSVMTFLQWVVVVFVSVLVHELGHASFARFWGQTTEIQLGSLGGITSFHGATLSRAKEFLVVLAGPVFGLLLCAFSFWLLVTNLFGPSLGYFLKVMVRANFIWSVVNLFPVHPLDGGKLMGIALEGLFGPNGMRTSYFLSGVFAILATAYFLMTNNIFAGAFFVLCAFESFRSWQLQRFYRTTASENIFMELGRAEREWQNNQPESAINRLEAIIKNEKSNEARDAAVDLLAGYFVSTGQNQKAFSLLLPFKNRLSSKTLKVFQLVCYKLQNWPLALEIGNRAFLEEQDVPCAIMNAFCSAHLHNVQAAINWLTFVKKTKLADMKALLSSHDFDEIRSDATFKTFIVSTG